VKQVGSAAALTLAVVMQAGTGMAETPLERGTYLEQAVVACGNCHTPMGPDGPLPGMELAGGLLIDEPGFFSVQTSNITPDMETGIGSWSDADLIRAIREGIRPDGRIIGPPMPIAFYRGLSDRDVLAIVAYVRQVPAVSNAVPPGTYHIPLPPAYGPPVESVAEIDPADTLAYGAYIAGPLAHCLDCHTPHGEAGPDMTRIGQGGMHISGPWGVSVAANITSHHEDGIGAWSDGEIERAIRAGVRPDGTRLAPPMAFYAYAQMSDSDMAALIAYLRTLPPLPDTE
jgi:mono/diheme cytochrome c family protein